MPAQEFSVVEKAILILSQTVGTQGTPVDKIWLGLFKATQN